MFVSTLSRNYVSLLNEIKELISNQQMGKITTRLHRFGSEGGTRRDKNGKLQNIKRQTALFALNFRFCFLH